MSFLYCCLLFMLSLLKMSTSFLVRFAIFLSIFYFLFWYSPGVENYIFVSVVVATILKHWYNFYYVEETETPVRGQEKDA